MPNSTIHDIVHDIVHSTGSEGIGLDLGRNGYQLLLLLLLSFGGADVVVTSAVVEGVAAKDRRGPAEPRKATTFTGRLSSFLDAGTIGILMTRPLVPVLVVWVLL